MPKTKPTPIATHIAPYCGDKRSLRALCGERLDSYRHVAATDGKPTCQECRDLDEQAERDVLALRASL